MKLFVLLSAFFIGRVVQATPLSLATGSGTAVLTKTAFSTSQEDVLSTIHAAATSPVRATSLEERDVFQLVVFCGGENCSGVCQPFSNPGLFDDSCFAPIPVTFLSVFIDDPSDDDFPFQVGVAANTNCTGLSIIPEANVCFNVSPFGESWEVFVGPTEG